MRLGVLVVGEWEGVRLGSKRGNFRSLLGHYRSLLGRSSRECKAAWQSWRSREA